MDGGGQIKFKNRRMIIYLVGCIISYICLLFSKGIRKVDVWDILLFIPLISVGSWITVIYLIYYKFVGI